MKRAIAFIAAAGFVVATAIGLTTWSSTEDATQAFGVESQPKVATFPEVPNSVAKIINPEVSPEIKNRGMLVVEETYGGNIGSSVSALLGQRPADASFAFADRGMIVVEDVYEGNVGSGVSAFMSLKPLGAFFVFTDRGMFVVEKLDYELPTDLSNQQPRAPESIGVVRGTNGLGNVRG